MKEGRKEQTNANQENHHDQDFRCCWIPALYYTILMLMFTMKDPWKCGGRRWRWRRRRWRNLHISHFCCFLLSPSNPDQDAEYARALDALVKAVSGSRLGCPFWASWLWDHLLGTGNLSRSCLEIQELLWSSDIICGHFGPSGARISWFLGNLDQPLTRSDVLITSADGSRVFLGKRKALPRETWVSRWPLEILLKWDSLRNSFFSPFPGFICC